ncbi:MAG TPA: hypothetical protein VNA12_04255 [Mycobacteriales bacterium]|nr:hypothetical protein [Mycobacteriales bacterium]
MTTDQLRRTGARAAIAAAVIGVPADLYHFTIDSRAAASQSLGFRLHGLGLLVAFTLTLVALATITLSREPRSGPLGAIAAALALVGTTFVIGDIAKEAFALPVAPDALSDPKGYYLAVIVASFAALTLGWLLTAVASKRAGIIGGGPTALLVVGALLAFPPIPGAYVVLLVGIAVVATRAAETPAEGVPSYSGRAAAGMAGARR